MLYRAFGSKTILCNALGIYRCFKAFGVQRPYPRHPNVPLLWALWSLLVGIWGILKGSWAVLDYIGFLGYLEP